MSTWYSTSLQENKVPPQWVLYEAPTSECERVVQSETLKPYGHCIEEHVLGPWPETVPHFDTQVKVVLASCILHNWILGWSDNEFFEEVITYDEVDTVHGVKACDNDVWKEKRLEWAHTMWKARGNTIIWEEELKNPPLIPCFSNPNLIPICWTTLWW
jgi:hypothetical protein